MGGFYTAVSQRLQAVTGQVCWAIVARVFTLRFYNAHLLSRYELHCDLGA
jgi:hypothetical protein